ncbi:MAG: amidohydrolase family protein, partial [Bacteroidia bacterium]
TLNGAAALQISEQVGSLEIGKKADLILTKPIVNLARIPYSFGSQLIEKVMVGGEWA